MLVDNDHALILYNFFFPLILGWLYYTRNQESTSVHCQTSSYMLLIIRKGKFLF